MGQVFANITLKNAWDVSNVAHGVIKAPAVREIAVRALADTGAMTLVINELIQAQLGLKVVGLRKATLGDNTKAVCKVTEPVEVHWNNRSCTCRAWVFPGDGMVLLGAIPLEDMDLLVNPVTQQVEGAHGDEQMALVL